jgi:hypothetical protein
MFRIPLLRWRGIRQMPTDMERQDARPGIAVRMVTSVMEGALLWEPGFFA